MPEQDVIGLDIVCQRMKSQNKNKVLTRHDLSEPCACIYSGVCIYSVEKFSTTEKRKGKQFQVVRLWVFLFCFLLKKIAFLPVACRCIYAHPKTTFLGDETRLCVLP